MEVHTAQGTMTVAKIPNAEAFEVVIKDNGGNVIRVDRIPQANMEAVAKAVLEAVAQGGSNAELNKLAGTPSPPPPPPNLIAQRPPVQTNPRTGKRRR